MIPVSIMNYLLKTDYVNKWKEMSDKELVRLQDTLVEKINIASENSPSVAKSITEVLEILENYMVERGIL